MKIITYNLNGIRSAISKGLLDWIKEDNADIYCFQETKAHEIDIDKAAFEKLGYNTYFFSAQKKGYSGVAILCKSEPKNVVFGTGIDYMDFEGRNIRVDFDGISVMSLYLPSGTNIDRLDHKFKYMDDFFDYINHLKKSIPNLVICGDYNICHEAIDIHDPIRNAKVSGFLPEERAWMDKFLDAGWVDTFRHFHSEPHRYSWWSQRFPSVRLNNKGWRIDYFTVTEPLKKQLVGADIYHDVKHSDHCPVYLEVKLK